jgi:hypothetical protein
MAEKRGNDLDAESSQCFVTKYGQMTARDQLTLQTDRHCLKILDGH